METFIHSFKINNKLCDNLIKYHKKNIEYKTKGHVMKGEEHFFDKNIKDSIDVTFVNTSQNKHIKEYFKELSKGLEEYIKKYEIKSSFITDDINLIQYYPPNGGYKVWHCERSCNNFKLINRYLVYMTYLNTVTDGGETEFFWQKIKFKPEKGLSLIWPSDFTHTHRGIPSPSQKKYIVTGWFNLL